jgi:hypothetical protein
VVVAKGPQEEEAEEGSDVREGQPPTRTNASLRRTKPRSRGPRVWQPGRR